MLVVGLLVAVVLLAGAVAIRSRAAVRRPPEATEPRVLSPERRLWEIWKRLGWGERVTMLALVVGGLGSVSFALYGLVLLVW